MFISELVVRILGIYTQKSLFYSKSPGKFWSGIVEYVTIT
jgi:hypothetical protein